LKEGHSNVDIVALDINSEDSIKEAIALVLEKKKEELIFW